MGWKKLQESALFSPPLHSGRDFSLENAVHHLSNLRHIELDFDYGDLNLNRLILLQSVTMTGIEIQAIALNFPSLRAGSFNCPSLTNLSIQAPKLVELRYNPPMVMEGVELPEDVLTCSQILWAAVTSKSTIFRITRCITI